MNLIHYRGLNCYLACVVNVAAALGVNERDAFATLWSETDFAYDPNYQVYSSERVLQNLEALGVEIEKLPCAAPEQTAQSLLRIEEGALFLVGMDTIYVPWSPVYRYFHGPHYFFARMERAESILCYDPIYNGNDVRMRTSEIISFANEISGMRRLTVKPWRIDLRREAREAQKAIPALRKAIWREVDPRGNEAQKNMRVLTKRMDAIINNRYLFGHFLHESPSAPDWARQYFDRAFMSRWEAVRHGLLKALIVKRNEDVTDAVWSLLSQLLDEEMRMAAEIWGCCNQETDE